MTAHWTADESLEFHALCLARRSLERLRDCLKTGEGGITWRNPFAQFEYKIELADTDSSFKQEYPPKLALLLQRLTWNVLIRKGEPGRPEQYLFIPEVEAAINALPESEREAKRNQLATGYELPERKTTGTTPAGNHPFACTLIFAVRPLTWDMSESHGFYAIQIGLDFTEGDPSTWAEEDRAAFIAHLLAEIRKRAALYPKEHAGAKPMAKLPTPDEVRSIRMAAGFQPLHKLSERKPSGLPLFPEAKELFHELRTPLNWAVGLALFRFTPPDRPKDEQEVALSDLTDRVYCLTERGAPRRGDQVEDILSEVLKLYNETIAVGTQITKKYGRFTERKMDLQFFRIISELNLTYIDTKTGKRVHPEDCDLPPSAIGPLIVGGRRHYRPDGTTVKALIGDRWKLVAIRWFWTQSIAKDLESAPELDKKGNVKRDRSGKVIRGGFYIKIAENIFNALFRLRSERAFIANDLLILLATDIYKPPPQIKADCRNVIEREADRLFDLLGLKDDPHKPGWREEALAKAIFRLKQPDIAALLPGSDEYPRQPSAAELAGWRRKNPYYRLIRSALYVPPSILTKEEGAALKAEQEAISLPAPANPPAQPARPRVNQLLLPGMKQPPPIPSGPEIRAALDAAQMNLRAFAKLIGGPSFNTWARYARGESIRVDKIGQEAWERTRAFVAKHGPKSAVDGGKGAP